MEQNSDSEEKSEQTLNEQRIRKITSLYYSRQDVQKALFEFSKNREICPRYFEGFGKRPDSFQYQGDVFELVKKGATSFHCSEEIWRDAMKLSTNLAREQMNELRIGWDLLIDIDSKYIDYSKIAAQVIIKLLNFHRVKNIGIKFSGSKGFHLLIPWKSFPKEINRLKTSDMFPEWARIIVQYIHEKAKPMLIEKISSLERANKYIKDFRVSESVIPDLILVSPRHLFRMPYSLHEKTALASVVISPEQIENFQLKDANPLKAEVRNFIPDSKEDEAYELLVQSLDWYREKGNEKGGGNVGGNLVPLKFKPIKILNLSESAFPPSIQKILKGIADGKKRALFILINFFRSIGMEKDELEKRIKEWNKKNTPPLKESYIKPQLLWAYRNKTAPPPNYNKDYYKGIGIVPTEEELRYKNPVNFMVKKQEKSKIFKN
jgi:DNA primase catalytic subunit